MPTVQQLIREVQKTVKDPTYDQDIVEYLNEALHQVARSDRPLILLPDLETSGSVTTSTSTCHVDLPDTYCRHLYKVECAANEYADILILPGLKALKREYSDGLDETGDVGAVTIVGNQLYYADIPEEADTLTLYYYGIPTDFSETDTEEITVIPVDFQKPILCGWAAGRIFKDKAVNTKDNFWLTMARDSFSACNEGIQELSYEIEYKSPRTRHYRRYPRFF